jgi:hypothetical protein
MSLGGFSILKLQDILQIPLKYSNNTITLFQTVTIQLWNIVREQLGENCTCTTTSCVDYVGVVQSRSVVEHDFIRVLALALVSSHQLS